MALAVTTRCLLSSVRLPTTRCRIFSQKVNQKALIGNHTCRKWFSISNVSLTERRYSEKHEWVSKRGDVGTVGISNYAQEALGDVVYVQLPEVGTEVAKNEEVGAVESVKAASEVYTPVTGKVTEVNVALEDKPGLVNTSPYDKGWLFKLTLPSADEYNKLMDENQYIEYLKKVKH